MKQNIFGWLAGSKIGKESEVIKSVLRDKGGEESPGDRLGKKLTAIVTKGLAESPGYIPPDVTSFDQYDSWLSSQEVVRALENDAAVFTLLVENIMGAPGIVDKAGAVKTLARELANRSDGES